MSVFRSLNKGDSASECRKYVNLNKEWFETNFIIVNERLEDIQLPNICIKSNIESSCSIHV